MRSLMCGLLVVGSGCATITPLTLAEDPSVFRAPAASKYPSADAAYLLREQRTVMVSRWSGGSFVEFQVHDVLAILTEDGFNRANVRVDYPDKGDITDFEARTIGADGQAAPVTNLNVHDDTALTTEKASYKARIFSFPNVAVGSVLEYRYTVHVPGRLSHLDDFLNADIPVERLVLEVSGTGDIRYQTKIYNTDQKWVESTEGNRWVLRWSADNIRASKQEEFDPARTVRDPWWVFTVLQLTKYNVAFDWNRTWATTYDGRIKALSYDNEEYYANFTPDLKVAPNATGFQRVAGALDWVRTRWRTPKAGNYPGRKAGTLDGLGEATGMERTRVLWKLLTDLGMKVEYAVTNRVNARLEDRDLPWPGAFATHVLYLPVQPGLPAELWVDGACDFCATGEIPWWLQGREAMVLYAELPTGKDTPKLTPKWQAIAGPKAPPERVERRTQATIAPDLSLTLVDSVRETAGRASDARDYFLSSTEKVLTDDAEKSLKARLPAAAMTRRVPQALDPSVRTVTRGVEATVRNYAVADGELRVVPLSLLSVERAKLFEKAERKWPVIFPASFTDLDEVDLVVPAGWATRELPPPVQTVAHGVSCRAEVTATTPGALHVTRVLDVAAGEHPQAAYAEIRAVVRACAAFRDQAVTLVASATVSAR